VAGYVVAINGTQISVYLPEFGVEGECKLISKQTKDIVNYTSTEDFIEIEGGFRVVLFQKVTVRLVISKNAPRIRKKLILQMRTAN
jgi:exoribonuclease R